jgi:ADP-heptose:LPS heptosyltransferase
VPVKVHLHDSFDDLLALIDQADEIITADSLPAHLAQLFAKPHVIYYAKDVDYEWVTPYARHAKAYGVQHEI